MNQEGGMVAELAAVEAEVAELSRVDLIEIRQDLVCHNDRCVIVLPITFNKLNDGHLITTH